MGDATAVAPRTLKVLWSCLAVVLLAIAAVIAGTIAIYVSHGRLAKRINQQNLAAVQPVLAAIEAYRRAHGRYPESICDLHLKPAIEQHTSLYYSASKDGREYWFDIFPWMLPTLVMPSDTVYEYESATRTWRMIDDSEMKGKTRCQASETTSTASARPNDVT